MKYLSLSMVFFCTFFACVNFFIIHSIGWTIFQLVCGALNLRSYIRLVEHESKNN